MGPQQLYSSVEILWAIYNLIILGVIVMSGFCAVVAWGAFYKSYGAIGRKISIGMVLLSIGFVIIGWAGEAFTDMPIEHRLLYFIFGRIVQLVAVSLIFVSIKQYGDISRAPTRRLMK